ncbi:MAG: CHAT domain-containing protein [Saprospiraceae bacterium]|nr:CHAT domain-containing protein [Saprospiraceae bacterium]
MFFGRFLLILTLITLSTYLSTAQDLVDSLKIWMIEAENKEMEGDYPAMATAMTNIVDFYEQQKNYTEAAKYYSKYWIAHIENEELGTSDRIQAIDSKQSILNQLGEEKLWAKYYDAKMQTYFYDENLDSAYTYYNKLEPIFRKNKDWENYIATQTFVAYIFYAYFGDLESAAKHYEYVPKKEIDLSKIDELTLGNWYNIGSALYQELGDYPRALEYAIGDAQIMENMEEVDTLEGLVYAYNNLATIYNNLGDYVTALEYFKKVADLTLNNENVPELEKAASLYSLGICYADDGNHIQSTKYLRRAISLLKKGEKDKNQVDKDLINCYYNLVDVNNASYGENIQILEEAELLAKRNKYRLENVYFRYGVLLAKQKKYVDADKKYQQALKTTLEKYGEKNILTARVLRYIGITQYNLKNYKSALKNMQLCIQSLSLSNSYEQKLVLNPTKLEIDAIDHGELLRALEIKTEILDSILQHPVEGINVSLEDVYETASLAAYTLEQMSSSFRSKQSKAKRLTKDALPIYERAISLAVRLYEKTSDRKYLEEAFQLAEQSKSMLLLDELQETRAAELAGISKEKIARKEELEKLIAWGKKQRVDARLRGDQKRVDKMKADVFEWSKEVDILNHEFEENPKYKRLKYKSTIATLADIQKSLDAESLFLEYFEGEKYIYTFAITQNGADVKATPKSAAYQREIKHFFKTVTNLKAVKDNPIAAYNDFVTPAHQFYKIFIEPHLLPEYKRLVIIPDGYMAYVPFEVFLQEEIPQIDKREACNFKTLPYLIRKFRLNYNYSGTLWLEQRNQTVNVINGQILGLAAAYQSVPAVDLKALGRNAAEIQLRASLNDLPGAIREINELSKVYNGAYYTGLGAHEQNFKREAGNFGVLHLAMHGLVNGRNADFSSLAMTEIGDTLEDNFMYAYEVKQMDFQAALVVLSACETGIGKYQRGEGIESIGRSFMYAGIPSILMTLWNLNDESSSIIIPMFYENLNKGMEKDEAIRQAKLSFLDRIDAHSAHPALWACFVQLGDYSKIKLSPKSEESGLWWYIGGSLAILALGIFMLRRRKR